MHDSSHPLVLYVDPAWRRLDLQHIPLLYPVWGNCLDKDRLPYQHALFERHPYDTTQYRITSDASEANLVLLPYRHALVHRHFPELLRECWNRAQRLGKKLLIDGVGDIEYPVTLADTLVIRYGGYRFSRRPTDLIIPPYADDLLEIYYDGQEQIRPKGEKPSIGFAGWAALTPLQEVRTLLKESPVRLYSLWDDRYGACKKGVFFRRTALHVLEHSTLVESRVLARRSFSGHRNTASQQADTLRKEFVDTILGSEYALDVRGDANASVRLFEILSLGRIPIIVDTERNFPFSDRVDYDSFSLRVDFRDLNELPARIADFHASLSPERYRALQHNARVAYTTYFRTDALTRHLVDDIRARLVHAL